MRQTQYFLHIGLPKCASTALQHYFAHNRAKLRNHGFRYPDTPQPDMTLAKHQFLVRHLWNNDFVPRVFHRPSRNESVILSSEGLSNHLYDFPKEGLAMMRAFFSERSANGILITRPAETWTRSYYKQCLINPRVEEAPQYATVKRLAEFKDMVQIKRLLDIDQLVIDARSTYGLRAVHVIDHQSDILDQLHKIGIPKLPGQRLQSVNESAPDSLIGMVRQVNERATREPVRLSALKQLHSWSQTRATMLMKYAKMEFGPQTVSEAWALLVGLKPDEDLDFSVTEEQLYSLKSFLMTV